MTVPFDDDEHALTRAQWERSIPIIESELERGTSPDLAARKAFDALDPDEVRVGAMLALASYALNSGSRNKFSWVQLAWAEAMNRPEADEFAKTVRYYLPPMELIADDHV